MKNRLEDRIRDYLADHLDLLEANLTLVKVEFELPAKIGAGGRIDILARDRFGNYLVVEIKRSNQAARQALNEIFKYTGLFLRNQGLDETKVRLFVVSTEWHELLLPLSEYAEAVDYAVQGFKIVALPDGTITSVSTVSFIQSVEAVEISRMQGAYLSEKPDTDHVRAKALAVAANRIGIEDFVILACKHNGSNPEVAFGYALWFCFSSPFRTMSKSQIKKTKQSIDWDDELDEPEENFLCALNHDSESFCDTLEIGFPEKLTNLERTWEISVLVREGRFGTDSSLLTDDEIIRLAKKVEGGSLVYFGKICSPRLKAAWKRMMIDIRWPLKGNNLWQKVTPKLLNHIANDSPQATVSISINNPCNLLLSLYHVAWRGDFSSCPFLEICVEDHVKKEFTVYGSTLAWNANHISIDPETLVEKVYGFFEMWCANSHEYEDKALSAHNLSTPIAAVAFSNQAEPVVHGVKLDGGQLTFTALTKDSIPTLDGFEATNQGYLKALKAYLERNSVGLPGSTNDASNDSTQ